MDNNEFIKAVSNVIKPAFLGSDFITFDDIKLLIKCNEFNKIMAGKIMKELGFMKTVKKVNGKATRGYLYTLGAMDVVPEVDLFPKSLKPVIRAVKKRGRAVPYQLCPKCNGVPAIVNICEVCAGKFIIPMAWVEF